MDHKAASKDQRKATEEARRKLVSYWEEKLDEEGAFEHTFGDPLLTPFAVHVWVGYDEEGETQVELTYPAIENVPFEAEEGLDDDNLRELQVVAEESTDLLDGKVYEFAAAIYNYLQSFSRHSSLTDQLMIDYQRSKTAATEAEKQYKKSVEEAQKAALETKQERRLANQLTIVRMAIERQVTIRRMREHAVMQATIQRRQLRRESQPSADDALRAEEALKAFRIVLNGIGLDELVKESHDPDSEYSYLIQYLAMVYDSKSHFIGWQNRKQAFIEFPSLLLQPFGKTVQELNFSSGALFELPADIFTSLPNLQRLFVGYNNLFDLPEIPEGPSNLKVLVANDNRLESWIRGISRLTNLQTLDLERNRIKEINGSELACCTQLDTFNIGTNQISVIPAELIHLEKLGHLNMRKNRIVNVPPDIYLKGLKSIVEFLKNMVSVGNSDVSELITDIAKLSALKGAKKQNLASKPPTFLCDIILRRTSFADRSESSLSPSTDSTSNEEDGEQKLFPVHSCIVFARCKAIADYYNTLKANGIKLHLDPETRFEIVPIDLSFRQITILLNYIYTDQYEMPTLNLLNTHDDFSPAEREKISALNQEITKRFRFTLAHDREAATKYKLPHLAMQISESVKGPVNSESTFTDDLKELRRSATEETCDVVFKFPHQPDFPPIYAHKAVLCARSEYLMTLLSGGLAESQSKVVEIVEDDATLFGNIIEFCYDDDVEEFDPDTIFSLLFLAVKVRMPRLANIVANVIGYSLDVENVSSILEASKTYQFEPLERACEFFIASNWYSVIKTDGWKELGAEIQGSLTKKFSELGISV